MAKARYYCLILILTFLVSPLFSQLSEPYIEINNDWAYAYEYIELSIIVPGGSDIERTSIELVSLNGDFDIQNSNYSNSFSYNVRTGESLAYLQRKMGIVPLFDIGANEKQYLEIQAEVRDLSTNAPALKSPIVTIEILPQPNTPKRAFIDILNFKDTAYVGEELPVLFRSFSDDSILSAKTSLPQISSLFAQFLNPIDETVLYLNGDYNEVASVPIILSSPEAGTFRIEKQEIEFTFKSREDEETYVSSLESPEFTIEFMDLPAPLEYSDDMIIGSNLEITTELLPQKVMNGEEIYFVIYLRGNVNLNNLESLGEFFEIPAVFSESNHGPVRIWKDRGVVKEFQFTYEATSESLVGYDLGTIKIPYFDTEKGEMVVYEYELPRLEGEVQPELFWTFLVVIVLAGVSIILLTIYWIYRLRKTRAIDKDIAIEGKSEEYFGVFVKEYNLTDREKEILKILVEGKSTKDIADELFISPETARKHIKNILKKTETHTRFEVYVLLNEFLQEKVKIPQEG